MSTLLDFPVNSPTNAYILHDFSEIAYIVCTSAVPASNDNVQGPISSERVVSRLRNAEKQFQQASVLASLDVEKLELFTFYKKADVVKDHRGILGKFNHICQLNSCVFARKSAARILELMKPESSRIFHLFTTAILSNLKVYSSDSAVQGIAIGPRIHLVPLLESDKSESSVDGTRTRSWCLVRIDLQVITNGQIVLTTRSARSGVLYCLSEILQKPQSMVHIRLKHVQVYIAPFGQLGRLHSLWRAKFVDLDELRADSDMPDEALQLRRHKAHYVARWLAFKTEGRWESKATDWWVEIDIPLVERAVETSELSDTDTLNWKSLLWPASLVFVFKLSSQASDDSASSFPMDPDPYTFASQWYAGTAERASAIANAHNASDKTSDGVEEEHPFEDDAPFAMSEQSTGFGVPPSGATQMIYPTPPDGPMTHATPGMSSVDGLAPTPAYNNQSQITTEATQDVEMGELNASPNILALDDQNEDLFDDVGSGNYGVTGTGGEPNWDFFDQPRFDGGLAQVRDHPDDGSSISGAADEKLTSAATASKYDEQNIDAHQSSETRVKISSGNISPSAPTEVDGQTDTARDVLGVPTQTMGKVNISSFQFSDDHAVTSIYSPSSTHRDERHASSNRIDDIPKEIGHRGASVYNDRSSTYARKSDTKYKAHGKYWFAPVPHAMPQTRHLQTSIAPTRSTSSSSNTSMVSADPDTSDEEMRQSPIHLRSGKSWATYEPEQGKELAKALPEVDHTKFDSDYALLLRIVATSSGDEPFKYNVTRPLETKKRPVYGEQKSFLIAQILVDQISQSCIIRNMDSIRLSSIAHFPELKLSMDHGEMKTTLPNASLLELNKLLISHTQNSDSEKVIPLEQPRICVKRGNEEVSANIPLLTFWDTLSLQPMHGPKHVTAFCLHPAGVNVTNGCETFMDRVADTYTGCNLGSHRLGRVINVTDNGLIAWSSVSKTAPQLRRICQQLGTAIATDVTISGVVMIYMVCPGSDLLSFREMCHEFTVLFETFLKTPQKRSESVELALQLIPLSYLVHPEALVIPAQQKFIELALEVYNRLPPVLAGQKLAGRCESAVTLDKSQSQSIDFDLVSSLQNPMAKDGQCLHLAYARSIDGNWLTAAWSDESGSVSLTMSYNLYRSNANSRVRRDAFRDMWEISHDIMSQQRSKWRLVVTRVGLYDFDELPEWFQVVSQASGDRKNMGKVILLSANLEPSIMIQAKVGTSRGHYSAQSNVQTTSVITPGSTPQNTTTSPEHVVAATPGPSSSTYVNEPTPPDYTSDLTIDLDIVLVDPLEDSWISMLGYGLNQSYDMSSIRPAAATGLLFKRTGRTRDGNGLTCIEVSLLAAPRTTATSTQAEREALVREMLHQFRLLAALAVTRGCIDRESECVPWHIATAAKGVQALGEIM